MKLFGLRRAQETLSDEQAMHAVQRSGDHAAFSLVVERWETPIHRLCVRMTNDEHRAEDLTQETFARVFANRATFNPSRKFSTWVWRIAINLCNEEHRKRTVRLNHEVRQRHASGGEGASGESESDPAHHAATSERADLVRQALARLSDELRVVVVLREYEQLKFREIADVLDVPEGTVKWRMSQAMTQLSEQLKPLLAEEPEAAGAAQSSAPAAPGTRSLFAT